jgi:hypothetical protein
MASSLALNHARRNLSAPEIFMNPLLVASLRAALLSAAVGTLFSMSPAPAEARTPYDGKWSVLIVTNQGSCDRAYRYGLSIVDGKVVYAGDAAVNVSGRVNRNGAVRVVVSAGSQRADGSGRLSLNAGQGHWRGASSNGSCSGTWTAERR